MPVFRINILFTNGKRFSGRHLIDGVELDTYYRHLFRLAQATNLPIASFDVVQVSEFSRDATFMRDDNLKRMSPYNRNLQSKQGTVKQRRF